MYVICDPSFPPCSYSIQIWLFHVLQGYHLFHIKIRKEKRLMRLSITLNHHGFIQYLLSLLLFFLIRNISLMKWNCKRWEKAIISTGNYRKHVQWANREDKLQATTMEISRNFTPWENKKQIDLAIKGANYRPKCL